MWLSVKLVSNYYYCPALAWFHVNGPSLAWGSPHYSPRDTGWEAGDARSVEEGLLEGFIAWVRGEFGECRFEREPLLEDPVLKVRGRPDLLGWCSGDRAIVAEAKTRGSPSRVGGDPGLLQTALYAVIVEHVYGMDSIAFLVYPGGVERVPREYRVEALRALRGLRRSLSSPVPPRPRRAIGVCRTCMYRRVCPYSVD